MLIPLSPVDYYFLRRTLYTIQFVFPFEGAIDADRFQEGVFTALRRFPALRSRLRVLSDTEAALDVSGEFAEREGILRRLNFPSGFEPGESNGFGDLLRPVVTAPGEPLLKMALGYSGQRTFLAVSMSHLVGDGHSLFQFLSAASRAFHGEAQAAGPSPDRGVLERGFSAAPRPVDSLRLFEETGYVRPRPPAPKKSRREKILYATAEIEELKNEAQAQELGLTTNDVIMAALLRRFHASIPLHEGRLIVRCPIDYRRIHPGLRGLSAPYFGNAVRDAVAVFDPEGFPRLSLAETALAIRRAIRRVDPEEVAKSLNCLRDLRLQDGIGVFEELGCPGLLVSNLTKMPLRQLDYGCGPPTGLIHASLNPRLAALLSHSSGVEVSFQKIED